MNASMKMLKAVVSVAVLTALYTSALILIMSAIDAQKQANGKFKINFEYKVF